MLNGFLIGCNYWASHAGTAMWSDWNPTIVERDLAIFASCGMNILRVFPLWPDFQPIEALYTASGMLKEFRFGETPLPDTEEGRAGVSIEAIKRFEEFLRISEKYGLKIIVGLLTGWMSGRLFVPNGLQGRNVLTDPLCLIWETRFIRYFVNRFKHEPSVIAWDLGNECNVMGNVDDRESAWTWTSATSNTIRATDPTRPVISGMHSLSPSGVWTIQDQAENTDILTTHPYPCFTPHCDQDPANTIRTILHSACESLFYRGIGGKPCIIEEIGTLGPSLASEEVAADFVRATLFSAWVHNIPGYLWWCANDQDLLTNAPYDWHGCERELGLVRSDHSIKPALDSMSRFAKFLQSTGLHKLPSRRTDAICILTHGQDQWAAAYSSFVLAKQVDIEMEFRYCDQPLPDAPIYLLPSVIGDQSISKRHLTKLMEKVENGATLYISTDGAIISPFAKITGVTIASRYKRSTSTGIDLHLDGDKFRLHLQAQYTLHAQSTDGQALAWDENGNTCFYAYTYGRGKVFFLDFPLEHMLAHQPGAFHSNYAEPYYKIYSAFATDIKRLCICDEPYIGITEHIKDSDGYVVLINQTPEKKDIAVTIDNNWFLTGCLYGTAPVDGRLTIPGCDAVVLIVKKKEAGES